MAELKMIAVDVSINKEKYKDQYVHNVRLQTKTTSPYPRCLMSIHSKEKLSVENVNQHFDFHLNVIPKIQ